MKKRTIKILIAMILFLVSLLIPFPNIWVHNSIYFVSYVIVGFEIVWKAIRNILRGKGSSYAILSNW